MIILIFVLFWNRLCVSVAGNFERETFAAGGDFELQDCRKPRLVNFDDVAAVVVDRAAGGNGHRFIHQNGDEFGHLFHTIGDPVTPEVPNARVLVMADLLHLLFVDLIADADKNEIDPRQTTG